MTKEEIYAKLPPTHCSDTCYKCCTNIVQFSRSEEEAMGGYEWNGKCSIYENRPFVCRIFGASVLFECEGCTCDAPLGEEETKALVHEYISMKKREEAM